MMQLCFPTVYWHFHAGTIELHGLKEKCGFNQKWNCLVKTSRGMEHDWNEFINFIQPYFSQLPFTVNGSLKFDDPWMNVYEKGFYQEPHHHLNSGDQLSYCYFSKLPEGSGKFGFWNEQFKNYCYNNLNKMMNLDNVEWGFPDVKEGDLLIFPSFLIHQVTYHGIDEPRVTVSGNVKIVVNKDSKTLRDWSDGEINGRKQLEF